MCGAKTKCNWVPADGVKCALVNLLTHTEHEQLRFQLEANENLR